MSIVESCGKNYTWDEMVFGVWCITCPTTWDGILQKPRDKGLKGLKSERVDPVE